jgi:hypothetical protein
MFSALSSTAQRALYFCLFVASKNCMNRLARTAKGRQTNLKRFTIQMESIRRLTNKKDVHSSFHPPLSFLSSFFLSSSRQPHALLYTNLSGVLCGVGVGIVIYMNGPEWNYLTSELYIHIPKSRNAGRNRHRAVRRKGKRKNSLVHIWHPCCSRPTR